MNLLILGRGKTGSLVAEVAHQRRHHVRVLGRADNRAASALVGANLQGIDAVIDFTTPEAAVANIEATLRCGKNIVIGTTGWYGELPRIRSLAESSGAAMMVSSTFSVGMNLFFDVVRAASLALEHEYKGQIFERHHAQKKDAPSGTALALQRLIEGSTGEQLEITSFREGDVVGLHEVVFNSASDRIYLCHDAKSRRGYAEGAVRAAEWLAGKKGFFDFKDVWRDL
jgi:4-hydroxy-tetrahydrodipicolinate reductase